MVLLLSNRSVGALLKVLIYGIFYVVKDLMSPVFSDISHLSLFKQNTCPNGQVFHSKIQKDLDQIVLGSQDQRFRTGLNSQFLKYIVHVELERGLANG